MHEVLISKLARRAEKQDPQRRIQVKNRTLYKPNPKGAAPEFVLAVSVSATRPALALVW